VRTRLLVEELFGKPTKTASGEKRGRRAEIEE
jgi:hypothetical protein